MKRSLRKISRLFEGGFVLFAICLFRILPMDVASWLGGAILQRAGPFAKAHKTAQANLAMAMPELSEDERRVILSDMWNNIGRVMGEYPHLARPAMAKRVSFIGREHLDKIRETGQAAVILSGHFSNWEIAPLAISLCGVKNVVIYRESKNVVAEWFSRRMRGQFTQGLHTNGRVGAVESIKALKNGYALSLLVDQRMNDGSPVNFFGRDAMTATAAARLAIKLQVPILAGRVIRTGGVHFTLIMEPPVSPLPDENAIEVTRVQNQVLERWVREYPAQWFWVHKRWGKIL